MIITDNKKARYFDEQGLIEVNNLKESQHGYYTTKSFKPKQSTVGDW